METSLARIFVKNTFCDECLSTIRPQLLEIKNITNLILYPSDSLVVFNFNRANQLSQVLNTLSELGYPPIEDTIPNSEVVL